MSTEPTGQARIVDAPPIPTSNPGAGEFRPTNPDASQAPQAIDDILGALLDRLRALVRRISVPAQRR
jgi:hypothetical protein